MQKTWVSVVLSLGRQSKWPIIIILVPGGVKISKTCDSRSCELFLKEVLPYIVSNLLAMKKTKTATPLIKTTKVIEIFVIINCEII